MSTGKAIALSLGFAGAFALGVWTGPFMTGVRDATATAMTASVDTGAPATAARDDASAAARRTALVSESGMRMIPASSPDLQSRLKPVLMEGTDLSIASKGFRNGEQFATVAHASRNTGVNFMLLKDRVLDKNLSLAAALRELKPEVNAGREANRARVMARADIAALSV